MIAQPPTFSATSPAKPTLGEPAWELAFLYPSQGDWTEADYLALRTNRLIELSNGCLEVATMATLFHQLIVQYLVELLKAYVIANKLGVVATAPMPIRLFSGTLREPDAFFLKSARIVDAKSPPDGADLVIEIVSPGDENRRRDLVTKRREYAQAGIPEYWIVDPELQTITVLHLAVGESTYRVHGEFGVGRQADSVLLPGFAVDVAATFAAGEV